MYISNLLAVGTATVLLLVGFSSSSLACAPQNIINPELAGCGQSNAAETLSLEENLPSQDLIISSEKKLDTMANTGRFRTYQGRIIDTKDYIRARY